MADRVHSRDSNRQGTRGGDRDPSPPPGKVVIYRSVRFSVPFTGRYTGIPISYRYLGIIISQVIPILGTRPGCPLSPNQRNHTDQALPRPTRPHPFTPTPMFSNARQTAPFNHHAPRQACPQQTAPPSCSQPSDAGETQCSRRPSSSTRYHRPACSARPSVETPSIRTLSWPASSCTGGGTEGYKQRKGKAKGQAEECRGVRARRQGAQRYG